MSHVPSFVFPESLPVSFPPLCLCFCIGYVKIQIVREGVCTRESTIMGCLLCFQPQTGGAEEGAAAGWAKQSGRAGGAWAAVLSAQDFLGLTSMTTPRQRQAEFPSSPLFLPPFILPPLPLQIGKDTKKLYLCGQSSRITGCVLNRLGCLQSRSQKYPQLENGSTEAQRAKNIQLEKTNLPEWENVR